MNIKSYRYIFRIFLFFTVSNYIYLADKAIADLEITSIVSSDGHNGQKFLVSNFDFDLKAEELILSYQQDIAYCKAHYPDVCTEQLEKVVEYYQNSVPISFVNKKIEGLFNTTIKDFLHNWYVENPDFGDIESFGLEYFELRVLPCSLYQGKDTILFFNMSNVGVFYILDNKLVLNLDIIHKDMIRQFNLCKQYFISVDNDLIYQFLSKCDLPCNIDNQFIGLFKETVEFKEFKFFEQNSEEFERILKKHAQRKELKFHSLSFKNNDFFDSEKIISEYELLNKYSYFLMQGDFKNSHYDYCNYTNSVKYYRKSKSISEVNANIFQALEIIKRDLGIEEPVQLRVVSASVYQEINHTEAVGFFDPYCPGVVYITEERLQRHPIFIIKTIVHELEHYRQFWCYPGSFEWTKENKELLGIKEFYRQLEYGADKKVAEYFKCNEALSALALSSGYIFLDPKGYFAYFDYLPYIFANLFSRSKGISDSFENFLRTDLPYSSSDILDYLPSSGIYWNKMNTGLVIALGVLMYKIIENYTKVA